MLAASNYCVVPQKIAATHLLYAGYFKLWVFWANTLGYFMLHQTDEPGTVFPTTRPARNPGEWGLLTDENPGTCFLSGGGTSARISAGSRGCTQPVGKVFLREPVGATVLAVLAPTLGLPAANSPLR